MQYGRRIQCCVPASPSPAVSTRTAASGLRSAPRPSGQLGSSGSRTSRIPATSLRPSDGRRRRWRNAAAAAADQRPVRLRRFAVLPERRCDRLHGIQYRYSTPALLPLTVLSFRVLITHVADNRGSKAFIGVCLSLCVSVCVCLSTA